MTEAERERAAIAADPFGIHEAVHMASVCADFVGSHLADHPAVTERPEIARKVAEAIEALGDAYQMLGRVNMAEDRGGHLASEEG